MRFANPAGLLLGLLAVPIILLHMLRPRRPPVEVGSTFLWREIASPVSAAAPWQRLRPTALLVVQLLVVALFAVAAARPVRHTDAPLGANTVFILDASASMGAAEGRPDRLAEAKAQAAALRRQLPAGGVASLVVASSEPRVALSASGDRTAFERALQPVESGGGAADFQTAFTLAESLETPGAPVSFVLLSDGGMTSDERAVIPPGTRYVRIGDRSDNLAISRLAVQPRAAGLHAVVTVRNTGSRQGGSTLRVDVDGRTVASAVATVKAGGAVQKELDLPAGDRVVATLEEPDLLVSDNRAFDAPAPRRTVRVLLAGPDNVYVEGLLRAIPGVEVDRSPVPAPAGTHDLVVYAGVDVPPQPGVPFLAIAPPHGAPGVEVKGAVEQPAVTLLRAGDSWLAGLDLADVAIARSQRIEAPRDEVLLGAEGAPLLVRGTRDGRPFAYLSFKLEESNLPLDVAFPILGNRLVEGLTNAAAPQAELVAGRPLPLGPRPGAGGAVVVHGPGAIRRDVAPGDPAPVATQPGFWTVEEAGRPDRLFAVNPDPAESSLAPADRLPVRRLTSRPGEHRPAGEASLLPWAAGALLVLMAVELLMSRRSSGAPRRQRRAAMVVRGAAVVLIVLALVGAGLVRPGRRVATVFLVDASDSMGAAGRGEAVDWVREALEHQPADALAGVALFGADARVELTMQHEAVLDQPAARVVGTGTNLANALRLAGAVLPPDSRRRVVVVSDGRMTDGDAAEEIERLEGQDVRVDVHPVGRAGGADVAVTRLDAPASVREGESYKVRATVTATASGEVQLMLQRDGVQAEERTVHVEPGDTTFDFEQPAGPAQTEGVHRFRLEVSGPGLDGIPENDVGFAAVRVGGRERVLVAEGSSGDAGQLAGALRSAGLPVDVIPAAALPPADQLSTYSSTVLVDVDARSLSPDQVQALGAATRDLGRGLVVLGGDRSYSLGGYLGSDLEDLLPVVSEIKDPIRRKSVAEVLAIDTSGSMGACHCNPNGTFGDNRAGGGINKTDISRAGAARAISALSAQDEVGVLAFNTEHKWILPLQQLPAADVVQRGLQQLTPAGGTSIPGSLEAAAAALRTSKANLKHIILFTDGWTNQEGLAAQAAALYDEGITISVLATGEGPGNELRGVADAGHGRFYPGRDLEQVPQIMMEEAALASRNLVSEGEFYPRVLSQAAPVAGLSQSPALLGYLATTPKPSAATLLDLSEDHDPLLATWRTGLGKATAWTSDASQRWSQRWASWGGYGAFWAGVVKDTFPLRGAEGSAVRATVSGGRLQISAESEQPWPDGAEASARVATPGGGQQLVPLERTSATTFAGEAPAPSPGTYAVGVEVRGAGPASVSGPGNPQAPATEAGDQPGAPLLVATAFASQSYSPEYRPGATDSDGLIRLSRLGEGRGVIQPYAAFDAAGLPTGRRTVPLTGWLLLAAALLWPVDVALRRLALHGAVAGALQHARDRLRPGSASTRLTGSVPRRGPAPAGAPPSVGSSAPTGGPAPSSAARPSGASTGDSAREGRKGRKGRGLSEQAPATVQRLLDRKQGARPPEGSAGSPDSGHSDTP